MREGDKAPDFILKDNEGNRVSLADFKGRKTVVLFFYPKDDSPICTIEVCSFRDMTAAFEEAEAVVLGISSDSVSSHKAFADNHRLSYPLLADTDGSVRKAFEVPRNLMVIPGRVTYVIDREGIIRLIFNSQLEAREHVQRALEAARSLAPKAT